MFQPKTQWVDFSDITTPESGSTLNLEPIIIGEFDTIDVDGDGLNRAAEFMIGTSPDNKDTDGDGIYDLVELEQGLDPLGDRGFPTGIISSLPLQGEANVEDDVQVRNVERPIS